MFFLLLLFPCSLGAQRVPNPHPLLIVAPWVEDSLQRHYQRTQVDSLSLEYAVCLRYRGSRLNEGVAIYVIDSLYFPRQTPTLTRNAWGRITNYTFAFREPCREGHALLHSHSIEQARTFGLPANPEDPWWRYPSSADTLLLLFEPMPFAVVQYSDTGWFAYYPMWVGSDLLASALGDRVRTRWVFWPFREEEE